MVATFSEKMIGTGMEQRSCRGGSRGFPSFFSSFQSGDYAFPVC